MENRHEKLFARVREKVKGFPDAEERLGCVITLLSVCRKYTSYQHVAVYKEPRGSYILCTSDDHPPPSDVFCRISDKLMINAMGLSDWGRSLGGKIFSPYASVYNCRDFIGQSKKYLNFNAYAKSTFYMATVSDVQRLPECVALMWVVDSGDCIHPEEKISVPLRGSPGMKDFSRKVKTLFDTCRDVVYIPREWETHREKRPRDKDDEEEKEEPEEEDSSSSDEEEKELE